MKEPAELAPGRSAGLHVDHETGTRHHDKRWHCAADRKFGCDKNDPAGRRAPAGCGLW